MTAPLQTMNIAVEHCQTDPTNPRMHIEGIFNCMCTPALSYINILFYLTSFVELALYHNYFGLLVCTKTFMIGAEGLASLV